MFIVRRSLRSLLPVLLLLLLAGALPTSAQFRVDLRAASIVQGGPYDVHFNSTTVPTFANLGADTVSALQTGVDLVSSPLNVRFSAAGSGIGSPVIERDVAIATQTEYLFVAYGTSASPKLKVLSRLRTQAAGANKSLLRFFNASTMAGGLDFHLVSADSAAIASNVTADSATPFSTVNAAPVTLEITRAGSTEVLTNVTLPLLSGGRLTVIVTGSSKDDMNVLVMQGTTTNGYHIPTLQRSATGALPLLRVVHVWPQEALSGIGYQKLDIFLNDLTSPTIGPLPYRTASEQLGPFTDDTVTVRFARENEGLGSPVQVVKVPVERDSAYTVILTRFLSGTAISMTLTAPMSKSGDPMDDTVQLRVAQAADGLGPVDIRLISVPGDDTVTIDNLNFLVASSFSRMLTGPVRIEVSRDGAETPFYTRTTGSLEIGASGYYTIILSGSDSTFTADVLAENVAQRQEFNPQADVPVPPPGLLAGSVSIAPNPAINAVPHLHLTLQRPAHLALEVVDPAGRTVARGAELLRAAGDVDLAVPVAGLPAGVYTCVVRVDGVPTARTLIVGR